MGSAGSGNHGRGEARGYGPAWCRRCGREFAARSGNHRYCDRCGEERVRERVREAARRNRAARLARMGAAERQAYHAGEAARLRAYRRSVRRGA